MPPKVEHYENFMYVPFPGDSKPKKPKYSISPFYLSDFPKYKFGHIEMQSTADLPIPGLRPVPPPRAPEPLALSTDSRRFRED